MLWILLSADEGRSLAYVAAQHELALPISQARIQSNLIMMKN
jgi:hypothetical protein